MALTLGGVTYVHTVQYFSKGIDAQGPYYDVEYLIDDWGQSDAFTNALIGVGRTEPHRHPLSPNLACSEAAPTGLGRPVLNPDGTPDYAGGALVRARYRPPAAFGGGGLFVSGDDPGGLHQIDPANPILWCTQELDYEVETITHPTHSYKFDSDNLKLTTPLQVDIGITVLSLTFHRVAYLPMTLARTLRGRINATTFLGAAAETVLFRGAKTQRDWNTDGTVTQRVNMTFVEREVSWNKFLRPDKLPYTAAGALNAASWDYVVDPSGNRRLGTADLQPLLGL